MEVAPDPAVSCPHLDRCSGCPSYRRPYPEQLERKAARLSTALARHRELERAPRPSVEGASPTLAYRTRTKWMIGPEGELGLFAVGEDHVVVDVPSCRVVHPRLGAVGAAIRELLRDAEPASPARRLRAVDLRVAAPPGGGAERVLVTLVAPRGALEPSEARGLAEDLSARASAVAGVALNETRPGAVQVLGPDTTHLSGAASLPDACGGVTVTATFGAFVQAHRSQAAELARRVVERVLALGSRPAVLELFAGSGALSLALAATGADVDAVEAYEPAAATLRGSEALRVHAGDAERWVAEAAEAGRTWDAIVVDPPRRGLSPALRAGLADLRPRLLVYVSCSPETLARDLAHLARLGLACEGLSAFDMMPQTEEVETLAALTPGSPPSRAPQRLGRGVDAWDLPPHARPPRGATWSLIPPAGGSGLALEVALGTPRPAARWEALAIARGATRRRGSFPGASYERVDSLGGHSLLHLRGDGAPSAIATSLARLGHPILGDEGRCDAATRRYLFERHGLDRAAWHTIALSIAGGGEASSDLPGDLAEVVESLRAGERPSGAPREPRRSR